MKRACPIVSPSSFATNFPTKIVRKRTSVRTMEWSRKRTIYSSGFETFDVEVPEKLSRVTISAGASSLLSLKKLAGKLKQGEGIAVNPGII